MTNIPLKTVNKKTVNKAMRGYNQQNNSTISNPQESFLTKEIEDYTIKDCEDFLAKYPNDLDADKVRKRREELIPTQPKNHSGNHPENNRRRNQSSDSFRTAKTNRKKETIQSNLKEKEEHAMQDPSNPILGKIILTILLFVGIIALAWILAVIGLPKYSWFPALGVMALKEIWK